MAAFDDTYLSPLKNALTGYSGATTLQLLIHLYAHYTRIPAMDLAENPNEPLESLESLYTRLNKCVYYATAAGEKIT